MKLMLELELSPEAGAGRLATLFIQRQGGATPPTVRELAALLLALNPSRISARLAGTGRHRWTRTVVEVPWSSAPASLYTCRLCQATRRSLPPDVAGGRWRTEYTVVIAGGERQAVSGRPECPGLREAR